MHKTGLNTGRERQTLQTAEVITKKLHALGTKSQSFWSELVRALPIGAKAWYARHAAALRRAMGNGITDQHTVRGTMADMRRHIVVREIVTWYVTDETRMRNYNLFCGSSIVPPLPRCIDSWRTMEVDEDEDMEDEDIQNMLE